MDSVEQKDLGLAHLKVVVRTSMVTQKVVAFNPNKEALFLYGSKDLNVIVWLPRRESHLANIAKREIGKPDASESIQDGFRLEEAAKLFGWTVCYGDSSDLIKLVDVRRYQKISVEARGINPAPVVRDVVKAKIFAAYLRYGSALLEVMNSDDGYHLLLKNYRAICVCHGQSFNEFAGMDDDDFQARYIRCDLQPTYRGLAIVRFGAGLEGVLHRPLQIRTLILGAQHVSCYIHDQGVIDYLYSDRPITFKSCLDAENYGLVVKSTECLTEEVGYAFGGMYPFPEADE